MARPLVVSLIKMQCLPDISLLLPLGSKAMGRFVTVSPASRLDRLTIIGYNIAAGPAAANKPLILITRTTLADDILGWISLSTNAITTFLIALKIWLMTREIEAVAGHGAMIRYHPIIMIIIESGAIISASQLAAALTSYPAGNVVASAMMRQLMVFAPTLIIVRVGLRKGFESVQETLTHRDAAYGIGRPFQTVWQDTEPDSSMGSVGPSQELLMAEKDKIMPVEVRPVV
ncbi:hypothetical protein EWM64_g7796 [Hericium alpestre]|uniref:Uncharacterized protein n=1 Tax=Hericium alpestre TaxID=135208 RepID=A0A4Y9ZNN0_9AGAM|nr:hypothetical protein EWM64_g7796 [Hericium alpestre]